MRAIGDVPYPGRPLGRPTGRRVAIENVALIAANVLGAAAFLWPFVLPAAVGTDAHEVDAPLVLAGLMGCLGVLLFLELGRGGLGPKAVALIGVLGAAMVALRLPGFVAGFSAMFIVVLVAGNAFGPRFGFLLGAIGTFASGLFVGGMGPWLPFQMVAVGWVGMGAGLMPRRGSWPVRIGALAAYGFATGFLFGVVINLWFWPYAVYSGSIGWAPELGAVENLRRYAVFYGLTSAGWDSARAIGNALMVVVVGRPLLGALDRAARRMTFRPRPRASVGRPGRDGGRIIVDEMEPTGRPRSLGTEESPDSTGQDAGESPRRGDPRKVPQKADRRLRR